MSNIEAFARIAESYEEYLASTDSITTWLLSQPIEDLERLPENELNALIDQANTFPFFTYDKSAENIFSNNIETWKNMGNVEFISAESCNAWGISLPRRGFRLVEYQVDR